MSSVSCDVCHCVGVCVQEFKKLKIWRIKKLKKKIQNILGKVWTWPWVNNRTMEQWHNFCFQKKNRRQQSLIECSKKKKGTRLWKCYYYQFCPNTPKVSSKRWCEITMFTCAKQVYKNYMCMCVCLSLCLSVSLQQSGMRCRSCSETCLFSKL